MTNKSPSWLAKAVMVYVTDAKSENAKKIAWKRARVVEHLHDFHEVPVGNIAAEILKRGGVEAVARLAAEEDPLRPKSKSDAGKGGGAKIGKAGSGKGPGTHIKSASAHERRSGADQDDDPDDKSDSSALEEGTMVVSISGDLRAKLEEFAEGEPVQLVGTRSGGWGESCLFEVEKVVPVVKKRKLRWGKKPSKVKRRP